MRGVDQKVEILIAVFFLVYKSVKENKRKKQINGTTKSRKNQKQA